MSGDVDAVAEFRRLTSAVSGVRDPSLPAPTNAAEELTAAPFDPLDPDARSKLPLIGYSTDGMMSQGDQLHHVETMRAAGMSETLIREALAETRSYPPEIVEAAKQKWNDLTSDPDFRRRLLNGDAAAARQWRAYSIIMAGAVKE